MLSKWKVHSNAIAERSFTLMRVAIGQAASCRSTTSSLAFISASLSSELLPSPINSIVGVGLSVNALVGDFLGFNGDSSAH